ncbi:unnamed protein product [Vitrella brassicaformis CCMP3155]|uniref:FCP1 homology domain-containing protein n=2 Tax=Vitrella brassicaformis TaxID=1169539 RepID=A0A0G4ERZ7_VITBC|nr:unnamed protein product [Vitrella brassicaformis CCMP3155]|eukprot:CEM00013.1 unnamed protein product [Vitrella brassicaformis CCMP3155]
MRKHQNAGEVPSALQSMVAQVGRDGQPAQSYYRPSHDDAYASASASKMAHASASSSSPPRPHSHPPSYPHSRDDDSPTHSNPDNVRKKRGLGVVCGCFRAQDAIPTQPLKPTLPEAAPPSPKAKSYLGPQRGRDVGKKTLVLDLDETLVHSSFKPVANAAFIIPVEIEGNVHDIYVLKRPGVDEFLAYVARFYEVVIFTASLSKYADPLLDQLDTKRLCTWRLFREACTLRNGSYVKDLSKMGRDLATLIIIDNSPLAYSLQPDNAIPIKSWFDDDNDRELFDLMPILEALAMVEESIPTVLKQALSTVEGEEADMAMNEASHNHRR